jgi:hypothetical protein
MAKWEVVPSVRISEGEGHFFYGYYDNPAFSGNDRFHLVHRVSFCDRIQQPGDVAEIGMIDLENREFTKIGETTAWNFQQGSMLQWHPAAPDDEVIFNTTADGQYRGTVLNIRTRAVRYLDRPVANVDPAGNMALSINFGRMFDFRKGYGYADVADAHRDQLHPSEDGIYSVHLRTGESRQILSLDEIWNYIVTIFAWEEAKLIINHITFNTDGTRFVFLARCVQPSNRRVTALLTANADGSEMRCISTDELQSHYCWRDAHRLLMYGGNSRGNQLYLYEDIPFADPAVVDEPFFRHDGHCSYSPDRRWILYDSYPDKQRYRHLYLYHIAERKGVKLGSYYADPFFTRTGADTRCDLHPRWNRAGTAISFDSVHENQRHLYYMDLKDYIHTWEGLEP